MRVELHPGFVLHRRPYRETSALIELLSALHGRVAVVARGARRRTSHWREALLPFRPLAVAWSGRGELGTLTAAEAEEPALPLAGRGLASAFYLNELLVRLLPRHDPCAGLYARYAWALARLAAGDAEEPVLRVFEKDLLEVLGYGPVLDREARSGAPIVAEARYLYEVEAGPVRAERVEGEAVAVGGRTLMALAANRLEDPETLAEAKRLMRFLLRPHLGARPLASRALLRAPSASPPRSAPGESTSA